MTPSQLLILLGPGKAVVVTPAAVLRISLKSCLGLCPFLPCKPVTLLERDVMPGTAVQGPHTQLLQAGSTGYTGGFTQNWALP